MGNASGKEESANDGSNGESGYYENHGANTDRPGRVGSSNSMTGNSPPASPGLSQSPLMFTPQLPIAPLQRDDGPPLFNQTWQSDSYAESSEQVIPTMITWTYGGNNVAVEGSWDNWACRKTLQRSGKDHSILLVLPSGIYHYKFIVDGEWRHAPDLPSIADEMGRVCNLLDVHDYVPENLDSVAEFEFPASPDSSYSQSYPPDEDYAKEPVIVPPQLHLTVVGEQKHLEELVPSSEKPQHIMLNHLYIEKGWAPQSVVALGLTHRFQSKYVTVVLYKPLKK
uniref:Association with the SNF1 complex (ASC) domain-containing protein n=1 Tax=Kalanchoe fedtschenkoi TaxID=63787 RepID=A0A7N0UZX4_KALFE